MFIQEIRLHCNDDVTESLAEQTEPQQSSSKKDFYKFNSDEDNTTQSTVESKVNDYLSNAKKCECLNKYPTVKRVFLEFNMTIPSSASVERLFSLGNLVYLITPVPLAIDNNKYNHCTYIASYNNGKLQLTRALHTYIRN